MHPVLSKFILCCFFILIAFRGMAANYYFSSESGNDSRSSSQAQNPNTPWKTINKLNAIFSNLKPGDKVFLKRGETFYGTLHLSQSGSSGSPIVIGAYGSGAKPIITSLVAVSGWRSIGNGRYESTNTFSTDEVNIVVLNNSVQERGRYPNKDAKNGGYLTINSVSGSRSVKSNELSSSPNFSGGEIVIRKIQWIIDRHKISSHSGGTINFTGSASFSTPSEGYGFFIQDHLQTLDQLGEWFYNPSTKKLNVFFGSNKPSNYKVSASTLDHLLTKSYDEEHYLIENIHFKGANKDAIYLAGGSGVKINSVDVEFAGHNGMLIKTVEKLEINNSKISYSMNNGMYLRYGNKGAKITNNLVENSAVFQGAGQSGDNNAIGMFIGDDNTLVEYNRVINSGYNGIHFRGNGITIKNNLVDGYCLTKNDGGGIYFHGGSSETSTSKGLTIIKNIILNGRGSNNGTPSVDVTNYKPHASGIFLDDNSNGIVVKDNTIAHASFSGIKIANGSNITVENNLYYDAATQVMIGNSNNGRDTRNLVFQNNVLFSKYSDQLSYNLNTLQNDIGSFGDFIQNYFARPLGDAHSISLTFSQNSRRTTQKLNLERWKNQFNEDKNSNIQKKKIETFKVLSLKGKPLYDNALFNRDISGFFCNDCKSSWASGILNGGALKVQSSGHSSAGVAINAVQKDKTYVLKFKAKSNKAGALRAFLRYQKSPWEVISPSTTIDLETGEKEYSILFKPYVSVSNPVLMFLSETGNWDYWIDDLQLQEAEVELTKPEDVFLFEYNASKSKKSISLNGTYEDAKGKKYSGSVEIGPYASLLLIRSSGSGPKTANDPPKIEITSPSANSQHNEGADITIQTTVIKNNNTIKKVEFYNGTNLLGSTTSDPYRFTWKKVIPGNHEITAVVIDGNNKNVSSEKVSLKIKPRAEEIKETPVINPGNPGNQGGGFALHVNTGGDHPEVLDGKTFLPLQETNIASGDSKNHNVNSNPEGSIFKTNSYGSTLKYDIPVPNGTYTVQTFHQETHFGMEGPKAYIGSRVFDILINGEMKKKYLDLYTENKNKAIDLVFENIEVKNGMLRLELKASSNKATLSGFSVYSKNTPKDGYEEGVFINVGSHEDESFQGNNFIADYSTWYYSSGSDAVKNENASNEPIFQTNRFGDNLSYEIPVENGKYKVITYHFEDYFGVKTPNAKKGQRVFDISIQGQTVIKNFDMYEHSDNLETALTFENVSVTNGKLDIELSASENNATLSGIAIVPMSGSQNNLMLPNGGFSIFINAGSDEETTYKGINFKADTDKSLYTSNSEVYATSHASSEELFQSHRFGREFGYKIPVPNGKYTVLTFHHESYFGLANGNAKAGNRVFNLSVENKLVKSKLDLYRENANRPLTLRFEGVEVKDGILNIDMAAYEDNALISGIGIVSESGNGQLGANLRTLGGESEVGSADNEEAIRLVEGVVKLYPNPATHIAHLETTQDLGSFRILIHNMSGQLVDHHDPSALISEAGTYAIPVNHLPTGVYIVTISGVNNVYERLRLVIAQ